MTTDRDLFEVFSMKHLTLHDLAMWRFMVLTSPAFNEIELDMEAEELRAIVREQQARKHVPGRAV